MSSRLELHELLKEIAGNNNVYYQPPESIKINYPAIIYSRSNIENVDANNKVYLQNHFYRVTVIDPNPDSVIVDKISKLVRARFENHFTTQGLNHDVFTIYYK